MPRILVVDDEPVIRDLVKETLACGPYELSFAADGEAALVAAAAGRPDLVLLDVCLEGGGDGVSLCEELTGREAPPRVVLVTGLHEDHVRTRGLQAGAAAFLTKPFSPLELIATVESLLEDDRGA